MTLNVATILIASTVLGTSENDQIHFFYHFQEARNAGCTTEESLRHTLGIAGRAIFFATHHQRRRLPRLRVLDAAAGASVRRACRRIAFLLSMIADFTALPAALWMVFREKPDEVKEAATNARPTPR